MNHDIPQPVPQGSDRTQDTENSRILAVADELRRRCKLYEAELRDSTKYVNRVLMTSLMALVGLLASCANKDRVMTCPRCEGGGYVVEPRTLKVNYVMLHDGTSGTLYKLKGSSPRFMSKVLLQKKGFEDLGHDYYMVYYIDTSKSQHYTNIPALRRRGSVARPWFATWEELMH